MWVPPFGEELNRCRRMISETGRALAGLGLVSALIDFGGTGDSEGEVSEFTIEDWIADLSVVEAHLARRGTPVRAVVAVRLGAYIAAKHLAGLAVRPLRTVLWQPMFEGRAMLTQMVRVRAAASALASTEKETPSSLLARLQAGESLELAGYQISPFMAQSLLDARLDLEEFPHLGAVRWIDVGRVEGRKPSATTQSIMSTLQAAGAAPDLCLLPGDPYWASVEIVCEREVIERTCEWIRRDR